MDEKPDKSTKIEFGFNLKFKYYHFLKTINRTSIHLPESESIKF